MAKLKIYYTPESREFHEGLYFCDEEDSFAVFDGAVGSVSPVHDPEELNGMEFIELEAIDFIRAIHNVMMQGNGDE